MKRRVRCIHCKKQGVSGDFFKVKKEGYENRFSYFCSELDYSLWLDEQKEKEKLKTLMSYIVEDVYGYEKGMIYPTSLVARVSKLHDFYKYDTIKEAFIHSDDSIKWALSNKHFKNEFGKTSYIMAIVENNINDVHMKIKREEEQKEKASNFTADDISLNVMNDVLGREDKKQDSSEGISWLLEEDEL